MGCLKMQSLLVDLILAAVVGLVFLIARRSKNWGYVPRLSGKTVGRLANFFALFWGLAEHKPKNWSSAQVNRGSADDRRPSKKKIVYR